MQKSIIIFILSLVLVSCDSNKKSSVNNLQNYNFDAVASKQLTKRENKDGMLITYLNGSPFTGIELLGKDSIDEIIKGGIPNHEKQEWDLNDGKLNLRVVYKVKDYLNGKVIQYSNHEGVRSPRIRYLDENGKDLPLIIPITIDEIIKGGIPNHNKQQGENIVWETSKFTITAGITKEREAIGHILARYNISPADIYKLELASKNIFDLNSGIQPGKPYKVICLKKSNTTAQCVIYEKSKTEYIVFDFRHTIRVYKGEKQVTKKKNVVSGSIKQGGGLEVSLLKKIGSDKASPLVDILVNGIYPWSINFFLIQPNDSFSIYFEEKYVGDEYVGIGKIFAASFIHKGKIINAFRFNENEKYAEYFDETGNNLRRAFLKAPLDFYRISSRYSLKRRHPVLGNWKGHFGTDYAAPIGTPIMTTASGTITAATYKKGNGNYVKVKHNETYTTQYLHMSKIKPGIKPGVYVNQGDIIGYVGQTGWATGPHVCYRFWKNGKQVDPYQQDLPPGLPLKTENKKKFEKIRDEYILEINKSVQ